MNTESPSGARPALDDRQPAVLLPHACCGERYAEAVDGGAVLVVERDEDGGAPGLQPDPCAAGCGFYLSLTTPTAFGIHLAVLVCDALARRGVLRADRRAPVELCLHEAVANAVVHGNLGIASASHDHPDGFRHYSALVKQRLDDAVLRRRRTDVHVCWDATRLELSVTDQGAGFDHARMPAGAEATAASGRGFVFMRTLADRVAVSDGGRRTTLRFHL